MAQQRLTSCGLICDLISGIAVRKYCAANSIAFYSRHATCYPSSQGRAIYADMERDEIPDIFWEALNSLHYEDLPAGPDEIDWRPSLPDGLTDVLEVAESDLSFGRMVHLVGDPASSTVAYTHVLLQHGLLGMRVYFPASPVPGAVGIPAFLVGFRDLPQVRRMYKVERVLAQVRDPAEPRVAYGRAVSAATVGQAVRALAGLAALERLPFTLLPLHAA